MSDSTFLNSGCGKACGLAQRMWRTVALVIVGAAVGGAEARAIPAYARTRGLFADFSAIF
ncbi:MAG: hypothetical protein WD941_04660 [Opitutus sp.]